MHYLVAAYLEYEASPELTPEEAEAATERALAAAMPVRTDVPKVDTSAFDAAIAEVQASAHTT